MRIIFKDTGNPTHTYIADGNECFTATGVASAAVNSDLGSVYSIDHLALWNEEYSGISFLDISKSLDNLNFITVASELVPVDNLLYLDYGAEVFGFGSQSARPVSTSYSI